MATDTSDKAIAYARIQSLELEADADANVRSCAQGQSTALVIAGSLRSLVDKVAPDPASPARQVIFELIEAANQLATGFDETGKRFAAHGLAWRQEAEVWKNIQEKAAP